MTLYPDASAITSSSDGCMHLSQICHESLALSPLHRVFLDEEGNQLYHVWVLYYTVLTHVEVCPVCFHLEKASSRARCFCRVSHMTFSSSAKTLALLTTHLQRTTALCMSGCQSQLIRAVQVLQPSVTETVV